MHWIPVVITEERQELEDAIRSFQNPEAEACDCETWQINHQPSLAIVNHYWLLIMNCNRPQWTSTPWIFIDHHYQVTVSTCFKHHWSSTVVRQTRPSPFLPLLRLWRRMPPMRARPRLARRPRGDPERRPKTFLRTRRIEGPVEQLLSNFCRCDLCQLRRSQWDSAKANGDTIVIVLLGQVNANASKHIFMHAKKSINSVILAPGQWKSNVEQLAELESRSKAMWKNFEAWIRSCWKLHLNISQL